MEATADGLPYPLLFLPAADAVAAAECKLVTMQRRESFTVEYLAIFKIVPWLLAGASLPDKIGFVCF